MIKKLRKLNYFNIVNFYTPVIKNLLFSKFYDKKRGILRNSYKTESLLRNFFKKQLNYDRIRLMFFNNDLFSYSNKTEKLKIIKLLNQNSSEQVEIYLKIADEIIQKKISIFEKEKKFDSQINWHYGFFNNFYWKLDRSEKIEIYPKNKEIDVKYVWELNRHQFLTYLGFAYYYTKDKKYALEFKRIILDWIKKNPPLYGINWNSSLEVSLRLISWIFTLLFFKDSKDINNNKFFKRIFNSMFQHAYYLRYFYYKRSYNHTVGDFFCLYFFSKIFEKVKPIKKWKKKFLKNFYKQFELQTRLDGTNIEQSVNYHKFVLEFFILFAIINPNALKDKERDLIEKMFGYLLYIIKPNGNFPLIGDSDDGIVLLLTSFENNKFKHLINLGTIIFQRGDLKYISKEISPISVLLLGVKGSEIYENIQVQVPTFTFKSYNNAGYTIMRNNWTDKANYLFIDHGRFGPQLASHSHSSITSFVYSYKGNDIIIDSGTYSYNKSWKERVYFKSSKAHNVLTINNKNQAKITSWFAWINKPKIKRKIEINEDEFKFACYHDGYKGFIVSRKIITRKELNHIIIKDSIIPTQKVVKENCFNINLYLHFNGNVNIKKEKNKILINNDLVLNVISENRFTTSIKDSFYSPKYGFKMKNKVLTIHLGVSFKNKKRVDVIIIIKSIT